MKANEEKIKEKEENIELETPQEENSNNDIEKEDKQEFKVKEIVKQKKNYTFVIVITIIFALIILILSTGFAIVNMHNTHIIAGISIRGIDVSGLSEEQALEELSKVFALESEKEIKIVIEEQEVSIIPSQFEVVYNVKSATEEAIRIGRNSNIFVNNYEILESLIAKKDIDIEISYNESLLNEFLKDINSKIPDGIVDNSYSIERNELIITKGKEGKTINIEEVKMLILEAINTGKRNEITVELKQGNPGPIDIEKIHNEIYRQPQNAYYIKEPFQLFPHVDGIDFNIEEAKTILQENKEEYVIPLTITKPEVLTSDLGTEAFSDLISSYTTKYDEFNTPRTTNVKLATEKINGVMVMPGETFSYNKTLGKRTAAAGYKEAAGYAGGKVVQMLGGGICQVSSTLYDAVVYANLEIVERYNHMFVTGYAGAGKDATVSYGTLDFKFKNTREYPIVIKATAKNGILEVKIFGIKQEPEYDVEISVKVLGYTTYKTVYEDDPTMEEGKEKVTQYGANGCTCIAYKIVKLNGVEISKTVLSKDTYKPMNKIIKRGTKVEETAEETVETNTNPEIIEEQPIPTRVRNSNNGNTFDNTGSRTNT